MGVTEIRRCLISATYLSRKAGRSGSGAGAEFWELSISEESPRPSRKVRGSSKELDK